MVRHWWKGAGTGGNRWVMVAAFRGPEEPG